jgi:hypothetical protein
MVTNSDRKSFGLRRAEEIPKVVQTTGTVDVFHPHLGTLFEESFRITSQV